MDDDVLDGLTIVQLPQAEQGDDQLAGGLPDELLFELLMC